MMATFFSTAARSLGHAAMWLLGRALRSTGSVVVHSLKWMYIGAMICAGGFAMYMLIETAVGAGTPTASPPKSPSTWKSA